MSTFWRTLQLSVCTVFFLSSQAYSATEQVIYSFTGIYRQYPSGNLIQGSDGQFYGTTYVGGANFLGSVYKVSPSGVHTLLHDFSGADGQYSTAALVLGKDGNYYGTTEFGGAYGAGTIFEMTPGGALTTLYSFTGGSDGGAPAAPLVQGPDGNFYGTTQTYGYTGPGGTVFKITPSGALSTLTTMYSFGRTYPADATGSDPFGGLVLGSDGNFYGTTYGGGTFDTAGSGWGTVFKITPSGALTTLHSFNGSDGQGPASTLVQGQDGNFYGTTAGEGFISTVFKMSPSGALTTLATIENNTTTFYNILCGISGLVQATDGNFYGTTAYDGNNVGTVFRVSPAGGLTTLYTFQTTNGDGEVPCGGLLQGTDGNLYGTTTDGGAAGDGSVFKISLLPISLIDPIADNLENGSDIVSNPTQVAAATHTVEGVAADSATQVVVRVTGVNVGDTVRFVLSDEDGPTTDLTGAGYLSALPSTGETTVNSGGTLNVTAVNAGDGTGIALAVYAAPTDFVRSSNPVDAQSKLRSVSIQATDESTGLASTQTVNIVRPPVALVHGIWGQTVDFSGADGGVWQTLQNQSLFAMFGVAYNTPVAVSSTTPTYISTPSNVSGNTLGFKFGATTILPTIQNIVTAYKSVALIIAGVPNGGSIAAVQVDVVAHSMGGDVTRALLGIPGYADQMTYSLGYVHKLITLDTPHQGSPLASQMLLQGNPPNNACLRNALGRFDNRYAFLSITSKTAGSISGAAGDMQPASAAINTIETVTGPPIPTAMIGGQMSPAQLAGAGQTFKARILKVLCPKDPLALSLNAANWPGVLGTASDAIVPLASQFDGLLSYSTNANTFQAVHSPGAEALGFGAPTILDQASGGPAAVLMLLNTPVSNTAIYEEKQ
jgi:uncharacterized repeat protein (TIGR03803 family)